jgi:NitT/TauT family transport system substrate-binding protein
MILVSLLAIAMTPAKAQDLTVQIAHFPNITHAQALVARNFERQDRSWFASRLGAAIKIEWYATP